MMLMKPDLLSLGPVKDLWDLADRLDMMPANDDATAAAGFDMNNPWISSSRHPCETAGCIGGWLNHWNGKIDEAIDTERDFAPFGVNPAEAENLCFMWGVKADMDKVTPQQAARAVRILAETGKCDWDRALREVPA